MHHGHRILAKFKLLILGMNAPKLKTDFVLYLFNNYCNVKKKKQSSALAWLFYFLHHTALRVATLKKSIHLTISASFLNKHTVLPLHFFKFSLYIFYKVPNYCSNSAKLCNTSSSSHRRELNRGH